jgi:hypothetical protein
VVAPYDDETQMGGQCFSFSAVDRNIGAWLFLFAVFNVFLGGMVGASMVQSFTQLVEQVSGRAKE